MNVVSSTQRVPKYLWGSRLGISCSRIDGDVKLRIFISTTQYADVIKETKSKIVLSLSPLYDTAPSSLLFSVISKVRDMNGI